MGCILILKNLMQFNILDIAYFTIPFRNKIEDVSKVVAIIAYYYDVSCNIFSKIQFVI